MIGGVSEVFLGSQRLKGDANVVDAISDALSWPSVSGIEYEHQI